MTTMDIIVNTHLHNLEAVASETMEFYTYEVYVKGDVGGYCISITLSCDKLKKIVDRVGRNNT